MSWFDALFGRRELPPALAARLAAWRSLAAPATDAVPRRWVVVDTETSGLDTARDKLLSIGAVCVEEAAILVDPTFEIVLRQESASSRENITLHGIGAGAQTRGSDPGEALMRFLEFARKDPLVAWHAGFDAAFLRRALKARLGLRLDNEWLDLAVLAPLKLSSSVADARGVADLDKWLVRFGIDPVARHNALADAYASAQLFQIALHRVARESGSETRNRLCDLLMLAGEQAALRQRQVGL